VKLPSPSAILVEHPAVPVPVVDGEGREVAVDGSEVAVGSLSRPERYRVAVQLTAAASLLSEFDLWPGRRAIREVRVTRTRSGLRATFGRFPVPLSPVFRRLGGGAAAAEATRNAVLVAIAEAVALPIAAIEVESDEPGFFLERAVIRQLRELPRPLDLVTARALWALRWDPLPQAAAGVASSSGSCNRPRSLGSSLGPASAAGGRRYQLLACTESRDRNTFGRVPLGIIEAAGHQGLVAAGRR